MPLFVVPTVREKICSSDCLAPDLPSCDLSGKEDKSNPGARSDSLPRGDFPPHTHTHFLRSEMEATEGRKELSCFFRISS